MMLSGSHGDHFQAFFDDRTYADDLADLSIYTMQVKLSAWARWLLELGTTWEGVTPDIIRQWLGLRVGLADATMVKKTWVLRSFYTGGKTQKTDSAKGRNGHKHAADRDWSDDEWLIDEDDVRAARSKPHKAAAAVGTKPHESAPENPANPQDGGSAAEQSIPTSIDAIQPVRVAKKLPSLPGKTDAAHTIEISEAAGHFMQWLLESLRSGDIAYNQTRALVHFTPEGMALGLANHLQGIRQASQARRERQQARHGGSARDHQGQLAQKRNRRWQGPQQHHAL